MILAIYCIRKIFTVLLFCSKSDGHAVKKPSGKRPVISLARGKKACVNWPSSKKAGMVKRPSLTNQLNYYLRVFTLINENRLTSITLAQDQITKK